MKALQDDVRWSANERKPLSHGASSEIYAALDSLIASNERAAPLVDGITMALEYLTEKQKYAHAEIVLRDALARFRGEQT